MVKAILGFLFAILLIQSVTGQLLFEIKLDADFVEPDNLENIYAVKGAEIIKYNSKGVLQHRYSNKINGIITSLDAANPLKILLFSKESNTITFLNQQLALISDPIDLFEKLNIEVSVAGTSSYGFWLFSMDKRSLMLFNSRMEKIQESQNLSALLNGDSIEFIREHNQKVYIGLSNKVLVFDMFAAYITSIHFQNTQFLKMSVDMIRYYQDQKLWLFNLSTKTESACGLPDSSVKKMMYCFKKRTYLLSNKSIFVYNTIVDQ